MRLKQIISKYFGDDFTELIYHSKNYVSARLFRKGLSFISIPIFTRLLVPEEYGILSIFSSFVAIFTIIYGLGIKGSVVRFYYENTDDFNEYYGSIIAFMLLWGLFLSVTLILFRNRLQTFFDFPSNLVYLGVGAAFFSTTFKIYQAYLQATKQSKRLSILNVIRTSTFLILAIVLTYILKDQRYYGKIGARSIIWLIFFCYSVWLILKISKINFKLKYIKYSLLFGIPVVFHSLSQYILSSFDRVIINQLIGSKETGLYSFAYKIGMIQNIISMGILKAFNPIFYEKMNDKDYNGIENLAKKYSKIVYFIALSLILFSKEIVMIMADKDYYTALNIVPVVVISYIFMFLYTNYAKYTFYFKKTVLIAVFTVIAGLINVGLNYLFIPKFGYQAAAWTTLISYASLFLLHYLNVKFILKTQKIIRLKVLIPNFLKVVTIIILYYILKSYIDNNLILFFMKLIILFIGLYTLFNKKLIKIFK